MSSHKKILLRCMALFLLSRGLYFPQISSRTAQGDNTSRTKRGKEFLLVKISSKADASLQPAYFLRAQSKVPKPLIVSLHTWSGDYSQDDPLADMARTAGWNYIHPDFRGPNRTADACLSPKALTDIDDAIKYAKDKGPVDAGMYS
jgi:hypothetical protein